MSSFDVEIAARGSLVRTFGERTDSRTTIVGIEAGDGTRLVVKHAVDTQAPWDGWSPRFGSTRRFVIRTSSRLSTQRHQWPHRLSHTFRTDEGGLGIVMPWVPGEPLQDDYDPGVLHRDEPGSPYQRFLQLPPRRIAASVAQLIDAQVAVAAAGFVAVDLYDGCVLYDFESSRLSLIDLDMYRPGPYVLEVDPQYGAPALQPPEEFQRGTTIDQRATVFTLGRMALICLGCDRKALPEQADFRGDPTQWESAIRATRPSPGDRHQTVAAARSSRTDHARQNPTPRRRSPAGYRRRRERFVDSSAVIERTYVRLLTRTSRTLTVCSSTSLADQGADA